MLGKANEETRTAQEALDSLKQKLSRAETLRAEAERQLTAEEDRVKELESRLDHDRQIVADTCGNFDIILIGARVSLSLPPQSHTHATWCALRWCPGLSNADWCLRCPHDKILGCHGPLRGLYEASEVSLKPYRCALLCALPQGTSPG